MKLTKLSASDFVWRNPRLLKRAIHYSRTTTKLGRTESIFCTMNKADLTPMAANSLKSQKAMSAKVNLLQIDSNM